MVRMASQRRTILSSIRGPTMGVYLSQAVFNREMMSEEVDMTTAGVSGEILCCVNGLG